MPAVRVRGLSLKCSLFVPRVRSSSSRLQVGFAGYSQAVDFVDTRARRETSGRGKGVDQEKREGCDSYYAHAYRHCRQLGRNERKTSENKGVFCLLSSWKAPDVSKTSKPPCRQCRQLGRTRRGQKAPCRQCRRIADGSFLRGAPMSLASRTLRTSSSWQRASNWRATAGLASGCSRGRAAPAPAIRRRQAAKGAAECL